MNPQDIAAEIAGRLEAAWNAADGAAFAEPFTPDADFVAIRGDHHTGAAIGPGHQQIFDTIYAGSTVHYEVVDARALTDDVILAHVLGTLDAPAGPLAGRSQAMGTMVLVADGDRHRIAAYHNTLVVPVGAPA